MDPASVALLAGAGLVAGFLGGLVGIGGGVIFSPVLFFYFKHIGVADEILAPLTVGSSLFCTLVASISSAMQHRREGAVVRRTALAVGSFAAIGLFLTTRLVTTQPWYDETAFQIAFSCVLIAVVARMVFERTRMDVVPRPARATGVRVVGTGLSAGAISAATGVGGGVVLVPAFTGLLGMPIHHAAGTSSATIAIISLAGVVSYATAGWSALTPAGAIGYVDVGHSAVLAVASVISAQFGAMLTHRLPTHAVRYSFAAIAFLVVLRLMYNAAGNLF